MLLTVRGITKAFGGLMAVNAVDLDVPEGAIVGLIGPNGSGKTTLFNLITGYYRPDRGSITLAGRDLTGCSAPRVSAAGIARTFQLVRPFAHMTALDNVLVGRFYGGSPTRSRREAEPEALALLDRVGLGGRAPVLAKSLTLVDRKRLELARALATKPRLLLLDELLAGLNPTETQTAMALIREVRDSGIAIIMVEHIVKAVMGLSDHVVVLNAGEKITEGTPAAVISDQRVIDAYLGQAARRA